MPARSASARLVGPAASALVMFAVLIGLGTWQLARLHWKQGVLQAIATAETSPPVRLPAHPAQFQKVAVAGVLQSARALIYGAEVQDTPAGPRMGGQLIQPLLRRDGPPILIDRGWVPDGLNVPAATPSGTVEVAGYVRSPDRPGLFSPHDDPPGGRVYTLDPVVMAAALGLHEVASFTLVELGRAVSGSYPMPATALPRPPNDHLSYAITWFGLAAVLVVVFGVWARKTVRGLQ